MRHSTMPAVLRRLPRLMPSHAQFRFRYQRNATATAPAVPRAGAVRDEFRGHATTASAGNYGLPAVVARAVDEIASSSDPTAAQLVERAGFVQLADLNGDGRTDYILDTSVTGSSFWCSAQACTVRVFVSTPDGYVRNDFQAFDVTPASFDCHRGTCSLTEPGTAPAGRTQPGGVTEAAAGSGAASPDSGGVPDFFAAAADGPPPLGSQCNRIGLQTERNGGRVTLAAMTDPLFALSEQFCLVRAHSIADGEDLMTKIQGASARQIAEQCAGFAPSLQPLVTVLGRAPQADVLDAVDRFIADTGLSSQQLAGTARVCLGVGYQSENITMAIGSALLLAGLGESRYAEVAGHHLVQGVGVPARLDLGRAWFDTAFTQGQDAGFVPGDSGRAGLIRVALRTLAGEDSAPADTVARDGGAVPVFSIAPGD
jgi:hypothetical protein